MEQEIIKVKNLNISRNGKKILNNLNFTVNQNQRVAVIGPNGAGKSFLLRVLSADLVPSYGSKVEIFGKRFGETPLHLLRKEIGFVSSRLLYQFGQKQTTGEVVASGEDGFYSFGRDNDQEQYFKILEKAKEKLAYFGIADKFESNFESLSDGEKRKSLLARALINNAKLLIFDEPAVGLDLHTREFFLQEVDALAEDGPLIYVTHYLEELPKCITDVILLKNGEIFAQGSRQDFLNSKIISELLDLKVEIIHRNNKYYVLQV